MERSNLNLSEIIRLPKIETKSQGSLTPIYSEKHIPFKINRIYYLYDIPKNSYRGGHAHIELEQFLIAISGSFEVELDDGINKKTYKLDKPDEGILINSMIWRKLTNFSPNSICLALASLSFNEGDYIRNKEDFYKKCLKNKSY